MPVDTDRIVGVDKDSGDEKYIGLDPDTMSLVDNVLSADGAILFARRYALLVC